MTQRTEPPRSPLGPHQKNVTAALTQLARDNVVARIWDKDHTVWKDDPTEITDRLGWLTISRDMTEYVSDLQSFADEVRGEGIRDVVLLGMGGSSLGPEVLRQCIGSAPGFPGPHRARLHRPRARGHCDAFHRPGARPLRRLLEVRRHDRTELLLQAFPAHRGNHSRRGAGWKALHRDHGPRHVACSPRRCARVPSRIREPA